jgi:NAD(P)-dependent dehydrogenase (short-subunit alcohol dehydrogenase family)
VSDASRRGLCIGTTQVFMAKEASIRLARKREPGSIINISSILGARQAIGQVSCEFFEFDVAFGRSTTRKFFQSSPVLPSYVLSSPVQSSPVQFGPNTADATHGVGRPLTNIASLIPIYAFASSADFSCTVGGC